MKSTVLITGASSGLGKALALAYANSGVQLLLTGRNQHRLQEVEQMCEAKGAKVETTTINVTDIIEFTNQLNEWDDEYQINIVVANAGISSETSHEQTNYHKNFVNIIDVNVNGVINTIIPLIDKMKARNNGHIVIMSSIAGFRGMPNAVSYSVSKVAVRAYGDAIRPLLKGSGIKVTNVYPGFVRTPLTDLNNFPMPLLMEVDKAASIIKRGIEKKKSTIAFPFPMFLFCWAMGIMPRFIGDKILSALPIK